jgi:hypothetical protein
MVQRSNVFKRRYWSDSTGSPDGDTSDRSGIGARQLARDIVGRQTFGKRQEAWQALMR